MLLDELVAFQSGFSASSIPAARVKPLSNTLSLFDAVPFFGLSLCGSPLVFLHRNR